MQSPPIIITPPARPESHPLGGLHAFESLLGLLVAGVCGVVLPCAAALELYFNSRWLNSLAEAGAWAALLLLGAAEVAFLRWMKEAYDLRQHPLPPRLALRQRRWPAGLRRVLAVWWLGHVVAVLIMGEFVWRTLQVASPRPEDASLVALTWVLKFGFMFGAAYASNLYLLLLLASIRHAPRVVWGLWRWRFGIDLLLTLGLLFTPRPFFS